MSLFLFPAEDSANLAKSICWCIRLRMAQSLELKINPKYEHVFPPPTSDEHNALKQSMRAHGLQEPISCLEDGTIIDGHTRFKIIRELRDEGVNIEPTYHVVTPAEPLRYILEKNALRLHLTPGQKGLVAYELFGARGLSDYQLAEKVGMNKRTFQMVRYVIEHGNAEIRDLLQRGQTTINAAFLKVRAPDPRDAEPERVNISAHAEILRAIGHGAHCPYCLKTELVWNCEHKIPLQDSALILANNVTGTDIDPERRASEKDRAKLKRVRDLIQEVYGQVETPERASVQV